MTIFLLISGSISLIIAYIYSSIFARCGLSNLELTNYKNLRYIYNNTGIKLYADFDIKDNTQTLAVFYLGYCDKNIEKIKEYYNFKNISTVTIFANGCGKSAGKKKQHEKVLSVDLKLWLNYFKEMFGPNCHIILHGFSDTALSTFLCANNKAVCAVILDSIHIFPSWIYKNIKNKLICRFLIKKSRIEITGTKNNILISSPENLAKDSYKIYELTNGKKSLYIYEQFDYHTFLQKLNCFITHLKPLEEST